eukprot:9199965-Prorocentrum_lima.AAC.1
MEESAGGPSASSTPATLMGYQLFLAPGSETPFVVHTGNPNHHVKGAVVEMRNKSEALLTFERTCQEAIRKIAGTVSRVEVSVTVESTAGSDERVAPSSEEVVAF